MKDVSINLYEDRKTKVHLSKEQQNDLLSLKSLWRPQDFIFQLDGSLLLKHYVGFVAHRQIKLQILPKIYEETAVDDLVEERDEAIQILLRLLYYSDYIKVKEIPNPQSIRQYNSNLLEIYISIFVRRFLSLFTKDIHRKYELNEANTQFIKGKVLFPETIRRNSYYKHLHYVQYDELTMNTILNQILKTIIIYLLRRTNSSNNKKDLKKALLYLEEVNTIRLSEEVFNRVHFNRLNEDYQPLFNMAKMFYYNLKPGFHEGDEFTFTFLVPLNDLFEYFIYQLLNKSSFRRNKDIEILYQKPQRKLAQNKAGEVFTLKPDITICKNKDVKIIIDAKYKNPNNGISQSDIYQMVSYSVRYRCNHVFLVYQAFSRLENPVKLLDTYTISVEEREVEISTIVVDIREEDVELIENTFYHFMDSVICG